MRISIQSRGNRLQRPGRPREIDKSDIQEALVSLYLRLNGYFASGFIVHAPYRNKTEMDVLAVRFPRHMEPEREVQCCRHLAIPGNSIDLLVGEVKGGGSNANFNRRFREDGEAIRTVLRRFGALEEEGIERVCETVPGLLKPEKIRKLKTFPTLDVGSGSAQLRFVIFATEQRRESALAGPYIFEDDLLNFVWTCFSPEQQRPRSDARYNYELWGPLFVAMVQHFKDPERTLPGSIKDLYGLSW